MRLAVALMICATPALGERVDLTCVHVTKSTLKQTPLMKPVFAPQDHAEISIAPDGSSEIKLGDQVVTASLRLCEKGGTWSAHCPQARALRGDVLSFYRDLSKHTKKPIFGIWGRKDTDQFDLVENVVLECFTKG